MSPKTILVWISWGFILTSSIDCQTIDDVLLDVYRRLNYIENQLSNSASSSNSNSNCNRNKISIGRRSSLIDEAGEDKNTDKEIEDYDTDGNQVRRDNSDYVVNDDNGVNSSNRKGLKLKNFKRNPGSVNSDRLYPLEMHYPYGGGRVVSRNRNVNKNRNTNQNKNVNVNKNVISRRSNRNDVDRIDVPSERDASPYNSGEAQN